MFMLLVFILMITPLFSSAQIIDTDPNHPLPTYHVPELTQQKTLRFGADIQGRFDLSCHAFQPQLAIHTTLNELKDNAVFITQDLLDPIKGLIFASPLYLLGHIDPTLYDQLKQWDQRLEKSLAVSFQRCEDALDKAAHGQSPYHDWLQVGKETRWIDAIQQTQTTPSNIQKVRDDIAKHPLKNGIPWLDGKPAGG